MSSKWLCRLAICMLTIAPFVLPSLRIQAEESKEVAVVKVKMGLVDGEKQCGAYFTRRYEGVTAGEVITYHILKDKRLTRQMVGTSLLRVEIAERGVPTAEHIRGMTILRMSRAEHKATAGCLPAPSKK